MQNIDATIKVSDYMEINIDKHGFDDTEDAKVEIDVQYSVSVSEIGLSVDVSMVNAVRWSFKGVIFGDDVNNDFDVTGATDESWKIDYVKSKENTMSTGIFFLEVSINLETKHIYVNFEC